jgi:very-short-patch-repair endonuclease
MRPKKEYKKSDLELAFETYCIQCGLQLQGREYKFAHPFREWRFDYVFVNSQRQVGVELDGGNYAKGAHVRGASLDDQNEKQNYAMELGWIVLRYTTTMLRNDPCGCIDQIKRVLEGRSR